MCEEARDVGNFKTYVGPEQEFRRRLDVVEIFIFILYGFLEYVFFISGASVTV